VLLTVPASANVAEPAGAPVPPVSLSVDPSVTVTPYNAVLGDALAVIVPVPTAAATATTAGSALVLVA
jgi:hypothetical protein